MDFDQVLDGLLRDYPELTAITSRSRYRKTATMLANVVARGSTIVDLGAWPGAPTCALQRFGYNVIAVDKDPARPMTFSQEAFATGSFSSVRERVGSVNDLCGREGVAVLAVDVEAQTLPLEDSSVDAVLFTEVVEHLWH